MAPRPDVGHGRSSTIEHRGGAQGWTGRAPACQEACPWPSRLVVMLLATKGSVCWSPSTAPAPPAVWLCSVAQVVAMKVSGTCEREKGCLSCMARTGLGGPMYLRRRSLKIETSHHHCHRVGAARPAHEKRSAALLAQPLLQRSFDLAGTCSRVLAVSPAQERRGSRSKIWHERCPQLATAKVSEVSGLWPFRTH